MSSCAFAKTIITIPTASLAAKPASIANAAVAGRNNNERNLGAERFMQEVATIASLQHPRIHYTPYCRTIGGS